MTRKFLFLLGSSRTGGNTEALARLAAEQLPDGAEQRWLHLADLPLPEFDDLRHEGDGIYPAPTGNAATLLDATPSPTSSWASDTRVALPVGVPGGSPLGGGRSTWPTTRAAIGPGRRWRWRGRSAAEGR